jgi:Tfp pilus assembly protein PilX
MARHCLNVRRFVDDQKGMAVVVALLILVVLSILGITLMSLSMTESQIGANESDLKKAFFAAEAGIQEAMYGMRLGPSSYSYEGSPACSATADPVVVGFVQGGVLGVPSLSSGISNNWTYNSFSSPVCSWTYSGNSAIGYGNYFGGNSGTPPGDLDSAGRRFRFCAAGDTSAYCTSATYSHKSGNQLANSNITNTASDARSYTVTVAPVVGYVGAGWQYVDQFGSPLPLAGSAVACADGAIPINPMYKVTSVGTAKSSQKVLSTMIRRYNINAQPDGTITANTNIDIKSAAMVVDGRN